MKTLEKACYIVGVLIIIILIWLIISNLNFDREITSSHVCEVTPILEDENYICNNTGKGSICESDFEICACLSDGACICDSKPKSI
ncbi:MAG: hypothetical protein KJ559_01400 [Nanoarchaeota archaeon]|nr:hypothetical protein [Nanoarchaeota archaeon]